MPCEERKKKRHCSGDLMNWVLNPISWHRGRVDAWFKLDKDSSRTWLNQVFLTHCLRPWAGYTKRFSWTLMLIPRPRLRVILVQLCPECDKKKHTKSLVSARSEPKFLRLFWGKGHRSTDTGLSYEAFVTAHYRPPHHHSCQVKKFCLSQIKLFLCQLCEKAALRYFNPGNCIRTQCQCMMPICGYKMTSLNVQTCCWTLHSNNND